ncbi:MAG: ABC transporter substrate-binding protein [Alphaproteobacteria bacterium]
MQDYETKRTLDRIVEAAKGRKLDRRQFMNHAVTAGLTAAAASTMWSERVAASTPTNGGTFKFGVHDGNTSDTHDPGTYYSVQHIQLAHTFRSYLTEITSENGLGPDLADSWSSSEGATQWVFEINKDATFHDGRPVTSNDVIASINHHRGDDSTSAVKALFSPIEDVQADGDHAIKLTLSEGVADLPWFFTDYHAVICPANEDGSIDWESGMGSGPYKIRDWQFGIGGILERHDGWHREGAYFDEIEVTILNDPNARQTALVTGDVDAITSVDLKTLSLLARSPDVEIDDVPSGSAITLPMFCDTAPFDDVNVRLALKYAINREEIIEKIAFGTATVGNDFHVSPNMPYYPEGLEQRPYDPDKAKWHLEQAGHSSLSINLSASDSVYPGAVDMVTLFREHANGTGLDITPVREPADGYWGDVWLTKPFVFVKWGARATPDQMFSIAYKDDAPWNESHWQNERFNELLIMAKSETDEALRAEMYREMCILAKDDGGTIIPMFTNFVGGRRKNVRHGPSIASSWESDGARATHRWWFEA